MLTTRFGITPNVWHKKLAGNTRAGYCPPTMLTQKSEKCVSELFCQYLSNLHHEILACAPEYLRICYAQHILVFRVALKLVAA